MQKQFLLYALRNLRWTSFPLPSYDERCRLIDIQSLKARREFAMMSFVNDIVSQRVDSPEILSKLNLYVPSRNLRTRTLFSLNHQRNNYAKYGPINQMMLVYNQHCEAIDFSMSRTKLKQYFNSTRNLNR